MKQHRVLLLVLLVGFMTLVLTTPVVAQQVSNTSSKIHTLENSMDESLVLISPIIANTSQDVIVIFNQEINVGNLPIFLTTLIIAFVDGFNPCSLWVLSFLMGMVVMSGSRKKILIVGFTYLFITSAMYGLFILGLINIMSYVTYMLWIRLVVASIATIFALVNIKDFFFYKKGLSFTIPDKYKPKIYRQARNLRKDDRNTWQLVSGAAVMAFGITLVELPCTAGFPVIWSSIISSHSLDTTTYALLFMLYILVYLLDELVIFLTVVFTLKASKFEEKHGRFLKLLGGIIMLALAGVLIVNPILLNDIGSTITLFITCFAVAILIAVVYNKRTKT